MLGKQLIFTTLVTSLVGVHMLFQNTSVTHGCGIVSALAVGLMVVFVTLILTQVPPCDVYNNRLIWNLG